MQDAENGCLFISTVGGDGSGRNTDDVKEFMETEPDTLDELRWDLTLSMVLLMISRVSDEMWAFRDSRIFSCLPAYELTFPTLRVVLDSKG